MRTLGPFVRSNVAEAGSALVPLWTGSSAAGLLLPCAGTVHGISLDLTGPLPAGAAYTVTARVNGVATPLQATAAEGVSSASCFHGGVAVSAGDSLMVWDTAEGETVGKGAAVVVWMEECEGEP